MTISYPKSVSFACASEGHRARQFANALDSILFAETDNQRWVRQAAEKLARDRAIEENRRG